MTEIQTVQMQMREKNRIVKANLDSSQAKPPSTFAIFDLRMRHQDRYEEYKAKFVEIQKETGKRYTAAMWHILKQCPEFGFTTAKAEEEWYEQNKAMLLMDVKKAGKAAAAKKHHAKKKAAKQEEDQRTEEEQFVDAIRELPATAAYEAEFDWLRSHPAICRLALHGSDMKKVKITVDDILNSPNGACPSQAVAYQLVNAANQPANTVKATFGKMLKAVAGEGGGNAGGNPDSPSEWDDCDDTSELESLLKKTKEQIDSAKR